MKNKCAKEHNHKKKYGQNFLEDNVLLNEIKLITNISKSDNVIEIGPGLGFLTSMLIENSNKLIAFEIDGDLIPKLNKKFSKYENFYLIHNDFLEYELNKIFEEGLEYKVIANIPYYITTPIIEKLLEYKKNISEIYLMVQKEVGERICDSKGSKNRSSFTHYVNFYCETSYLFTVKKEMFNPVPKVDSAFIKIKIDKNKKYNKMISDSRYFEIIKTAFSNKRKSLSNNLSKINIEKNYTEKILDKMNKSKLTRAEELNIEEYIEFIKILDGENV